MVEWWVGGGGVEGWWVYVVYQWGVRWIYGGFWRLVGVGGCLVGFRWVFPVAAKLVRKERWAE